MRAGDLDQLLKIAEHNFHNKNYDFSESVLHQVLRIDANHTKACELLANIYFRKNNIELAYIFLTKASQRRDCSALALYELGAIHLQNGRNEQAEICFAGALKKADDFFEAIHDCGTAQAKQGKLKEAIVSYTKALDLRKNVPQLFFNLGRLYDELRKPDLALKNYNQALSLQSNFAEAWCNKGTTLCDLKEFNEALICFKNALQLNPKISFVQGDIAHTKMKVCEWSRIDENVKILTEKINIGDKAVAPFPLLALVDEPALHIKCAKIYSEEKYPFDPTLGPIEKRKKREKIRIGYYSADFYNHATGYLIAELFELHDKNKFELVGFSFGPITADDMHHRLKRSFDKLIEVGEKSDIEIAQMSRDLGIDIAVDLKGHTQYSRTGIFSYRAAPIQVNYLGYPGTTGTGYIDYIIADKTLIPLESQSHYSEKVAYLPNCYQVNDRKRLISDRQFTRKELGLPEEAFVFCCFNNNYKILPQTFASWMRILKKADGSVLWLFKDNDWAMQNLKEEAKKHGIDGKRLIFADRMANPEHLSRHHLADLFIDTFPYNAHTGASDSLWAGLPVLTLMGQSFASRVAASLLITMELPELIATTRSDYEELAIDLALNVEKIDAVKRKLANARPNSTLFNTPLFTTHIEAIFFKMMDYYWADLPPDHI